MWVEEDEEGEGDDGDGEPNPFRTFPSYFFFFIFAFANHFNVLVLEPVAEGEDDERDGCEVVIYKGDTRDEEPNAIVGEEAEGEEDGDRFFDVEGAKPNYA